MVRFFPVANHLFFEPLSDEEILKKLIDEVDIHEQDASGISSVSLSIKGIAYYWPQADFVESYLS